MQACLKMMADKQFTKMTPDKMGNALGDFLKEYKKVRIIGGCCGTNPEHIKKLRQVIDEKANSVEG